MSRTRFRPDRGLTARMSLTMIFLVLLYFGLVGLIVYATDSWALAVILALGLLWGQWYFSDTIAMRGMRAHEVSPQQAPELHGMIDRLCALADMPKPRVAISNIDMPNAFATGRSPDRAVVCVTTGLLRRLDEGELEAVLSHELSHVAHRDVTVMTIASAVGVLAGLMTRMVMWGGMGRRNDNQGGAIVVLVAMVVGLVIYLVSFLLTRLLSRYRELAADRAGAILTGQPSQLASALIKISGDMARIPTRDLRSVEAYNAFFFVPALTEKMSLATMFATHPPLEKRLEQLSRLSQQLGEPG